MTTKFVHNAISDPVDKRDLIFKAGFNYLPPKVDLRCHAGGIENQKSTGSCVANATVSALELLLERKQRFFDLSRLFLYYNLRAPYSDLREVDKGCFLRDGFKSVSNQGICSENTWDFIVSKTNTKPDAKSYAEAAQHRVQKYERISGFTIVTSTKAALAKGYPVTITLYLGRSFYDIRGDLNTHGYRGVNNDEVGAHAMNIVGYDDSLGGFIVENSWGTSWGDNGYFLLRYDVMRRDCPDAWVCTAFDGLVFDDTWEDDSPDIKLEGGEHAILTNYKEDGRTFEGHIEVISGTKPYKFSWALFNMFGNAGSYIVHGDGSSITYALNPGASTGAVTCKVEGSGPLKKSVLAFITFKYVDTPNPNPKPEPEPEPPKPEPEPPKPEPDPPKPEPKKEKWWYAIRRFFDFMSDIIEKINKIF